MDSPVSHTQYIDSLEREVKALRAELVAEKENVRVALDHVDRDSKEIERLHTELAAAQQQARMARAKAVRECLDAVDSWTKLETADNLYGKGMQAGAAFAKAEIFKLSPATDIAELEGLVRNAARYRFIRGAEFSLDQICGPMKGLPEGQFEGWEMFENDELDAAIDAAKKGAEQ